MKFAAVMSFAFPSTSFHSITFLSGMFHNRTLPSRDALKKNYNGSDYRICLFFRMPVLST